ncbi:Alginate biosynthesis sensor protein KinB [Phycisphaerae bacterium RAS1]|nr:Alginate biosynthesis sensor protein KinB [Phycisphaerae bacterium RAS1]
MSANEHAVVELVASARRYGQRDVFNGKRRWSRFQVGMRLEAQLADVSEAEVWPVTSHNISGGGLGFWSTRELADHTRLRLREWTGNDGAWIPATVVHSSLSIGGYLVGVCFDNPIGEDRTDEKAAKAPKPKTVRPADEDEPQPVENAPRGTPLLAQISLVFLVAMLAGAAVLTVSVLGFKLPLQPAGHAFGLSLLAVLLVGLAGQWRFSARASGSIRSLSDDFRLIAEGKSQATTQRRDTIRELAELRAAFQDVCARFRQREDEERGRRHKLEELHMLKSNILNMVSHDLRTPLTSILLYTQLLRDELPTLSAEDQQKFLQIISGECTRLSRLVDDLLEAQRLESGRARWQFAPINLIELVGNCATVFDVMARSKSLHITVEHPKTLPEIEADADKITQVVSNLLSNAVKYTPPGGAVHVSLERDGGQIILSVADNGPGIPRDQWEAIFDRFSQLSATTFVRELPGVGLGLFIVRQIVSRHQGRVWVNSEVGQGSAFYVALPINMAARTQPEHEHEASAGTILVCDADPELAARIAQALAAHRYNVRLAHCAGRMLALLDAGHVDAVLTDVLLPDMDAGELLDSLQRARKDGWRLIVHSFADDEAALLQRGADAFVRRPARADDLVQAVQSVLARGVKQEVPVRV